MYYEMKDPSEYVLIDRSSTEIALLNDNRNLKVINSVLIVSFVILVGLSAIHLVQENNIRRINKRRDS